MNPMQIRELHEQAMEWMDHAGIKRREGDAEQSHENIKRAFELEKQAAELIAPYLEEEPSRSVLHRSAASLAMQCGEYREAERLICIGLLGNPPSEIAEELREVQDLVNMRRQLVRNGVKPGTKEDDERAGVEPVSVTGVLSAANSDRTRGRLKITDAQHKSYFFNVPRDVMSHIVKPLYEETVTAIGVKGKRDKYYDLQDIRPALHG
jgi:hypothetical protein